MTRISPLLIAIIFFVFSLGVSAQNREIAGPVYVDSAKAVPASAISKSRIIPPSTEYKLVNPRNRGINQVVPGKGLPKTPDETRQAEFGKISSKQPILSFEVVSSRSTPTDPTGAAGPMHYVNAWNSGFSIFDKNGNRVSPPASLASIGGEFRNETLGDPIVIYDEFADRFLITQFSDTPESFLVAVSRGPDPVNDGWFTYRFPTNGALPDYPKFSVWSDGYYVTTNKNSRTAASSQVVYVFERDRMLEGQTAKVVSFPLPGIRTNGFYSPAGFHAMGGELPPPGNAPIIYLQDDAWAGVAEDHLKLWNINVNWNSPSSSSIAEFQELTAADGVSPFIATFDGGAFSNLSQPGSTTDIDALQATVMYMTQYRRFPSYNSVVLNFVVDVNPSPAEHAGIRWYELRQGTDGGAWWVHQEGTYAPDSSDRFSGSIGMDKFGNIGLGFTVLNSNTETPVFPSIRYTGRYADDPPGIMTLTETSIVEGNSPNPSSRYGDYAHLTVDPADDVTFWHNAEYFVGSDRKNQVALFKLAPDLENDVGIVAVVSPRSASLGTSEEITVTIRNFGTNTQTNIPVSYSVNGGALVNETFSGNLPGSSSVDYTFTTTANLGITGNVYDIIAATALAGDEQNNNDSFTESVENLFPVDLGVATIAAPSTGTSFSSSENISITIANYGGEPQSDIPVSYRVGNNAGVDEVFSGTIGVGENAVYTFSQTADLSGLGRVVIYSETNMPGDGDSDNDSVSKSVANISCIPEGSDCESFGDGIHFFQLGDIINERIPCTDGYADYTGFSTDLDRSQNSFSVSVQTLFSSPQDEQFSLWIDFNDNGVFNVEERLLSGQIIPSAGTYHTYSFEIPADAPLGQHLLRVRAGDVSTGGDLNNPCSVMEFGTTHDYSVRITDSTLDLKDFLLNEASLQIARQGNNLFRAFLETPFDEPLRVTIHNILGQKMLEDQVRGTGSGYLYEFDMSLAARGVYLFRIGTREVGVVKRFIVE